MIYGLFSRQFRRIVSRCAAERSSLREPRAAHSLGRVVPAAWTALAIASAAITWSKPAGAGCAPLASAERFGFPGFLNVSRGGQRIASISASMLTHMHAGLDARKHAPFPMQTRNLSHKCPLSVASNTRADDHLSQRLGLAGLGWARSDSRL